MENLTFIKKEKAARLKAARMAIDKNRMRACARFGFNYSTYKSHESGARDFNEVDAARYANAFNVGVNYLLAFDLIDIKFNPTSNKASHENAANNSRTVLTVPVHGQAAAGLWLEGEDMPFNDEPALVAAVANYPANSQYARKVIGNSVSNRIKDGDYAIFVRLASFPGGLRDGLLVDCMRSRAGMYEHTVKVFRDGMLMTDSAELIEQRAIELGHSDADTIVTVEGIAVGIYRPLSL